MKKLIKKIKHTLSILSSSKGFTLIELLVVVLIIGILAAIALPKYKLAVLKTHYAKAKEYVEAMYGSVQRYYLINDAWPTKFNELDVEIPGQKLTNRLIINNISCIIWYDGNGNNGTLVCQFEKFGGSMRYDHNFQENNNRACYAGTTDANTWHSKLCQIETGKTSSNGWYRY